MTPEQLEQFEQMYEWFQSMQNSGTIQTATDQALRGRFFTNSTLGTSAKSASSENKTVNEGGIAVYDVLKPPDEFLQITVNGAIKYIPSFT